MSSKLSPAPPPIRIARVEALATPVADNINTNLPTEIVLAILSNLSPKSLARTAATCRCWRVLANDDFLWHHLLERDFGEDLSFPAKESTFKYTYTKKYTDAKAFMETLPGNRGPLVLSKEDSSIKLYGGLISIQKTEAYVNSLSSDELKITLYKSIESGYLFLINPILQNPRFKEIDLNEGEESGFGFSLIKLITQRPGRPFTKNHQRAQIFAFVFIRHLIEYFNLNVNNITDLSGSTVLHLAAKSGNRELVKYLTETCHLDVTAINELRSTVLHFAAQSGSIELVQLLIITYGLDVKVTDHIGRTVLHHAVRSGNLALVQFLINTYGFDVTTANASIYTILHLAARSGSLLLVQFLIETYHLNVYAVNLNGTTILHLAARSGNLQLFQFLIETYNLNVHAVNLNGETVLHYAARSGSLLLVQFLVKTYRLDINALVASFNESILHFAAQSGNVALMQFLVEKCHGNIHAVDSTGDSILHFAAEYGHFGFVKFLIEICRANAHVRNNMGEKVLDYAKEAKRYNPELIQYLTQI